MTSAALASSPHELALGLAIGGASTGTSFEPESGCPPLPTTGLETAPPAAAPRSTDGVAATLLAAPFGAPCIDCVARAWRPSGTLIVLEQPLAQINVASLIARRMQRWFIANRRP